MHKVILINAAGTRTEHEFESLAQAHGQIGSKWPCIVDGRAGHFEWEGDQISSTSSVFVETEDTFQYFRYDHLPPNLQAASKPCYDLAESFVLTLPAGSQRTFALQHLLVAKDAAARSKSRKA